MKRVVVEELLDSDAGTPAEVAGSLKDLRMFNSVFGGVQTMASLLRRVAQERGLKQISWVDVAGGEGYVATRAQKSLARSGITSQPVILDRAPTHLGNTHPAVCGDALALPFRDNSFDAVGCSLFMHHLEPAEIVRFVREGLRVARHAFLVQDLGTSWLHPGYNFLGAPLYRSRITRHDAPASVGQAYTVEEVRKILSRVAPAANIAIRKYFLFRMGVIIWKQPHMI